MRLIDADYLKNLPFERLIHTDFGETAIPMEEIDRAPTIDTTFKEVVAYECGQKSVKDNPYTCGNCRFLIFKDYEHHDGSCSITRLHRNFEDPCVHEEEMS